MAVHLMALLEKTKLLHPNEVEDQTCPICYEDYLKDNSQELPRKLPCGHTIGTECLLIYASLKSRATSIDCPWCKQRIVSSINAQFLKTVLLANANAALQQINTHFARGFSVFERVVTERPAHLLVTNLCLVTPVVYFNNPIAWFPFTCLTECTTLCMLLRPANHPRLGMVSLVLGFYVGAFFNPSVGSAMIQYGKASFGTGVLRAYANHPWLVMGLALVFFVLQAGWRHPVRALIAYEAGGEFMHCLGYYMLIRFFA